MAVYWLDPHIGETYDQGSPVARTGIHGTTDTTTRNGSYAAPFTMADFTATDSSTLTAGAAALSSGDELRIKGLSLADYTYDLTNTVASQDFDASWYYRIKLTKGDSSILEPFKGYSSTYRPVLWTSVAGFGGDSGPLPCDYMYDHDSNFYSYNSSTTWTPGHGYTALGFVQNKTDLKLLKTDTYHVNYHKFNGSQTYSIYLFSRIPAGVTITAGWTSATIKDGYTFLMFDPYTSQAYVYVNQSNNNSISNPQATINAPELYFIQATTGGYSWYIYWNFHAGNNPGNTTHIGGVTQNYNTSPLYCYTFPGTGFKMDWHWGAAYGPYTSNISGSPGNYGYFEFKNSVNAYYSAYIGSYCHVTFHNHHFGSSTQNPYGVSHSTETKATHTGIVSSGSRTKPSVSRPSSGSFLGEYGPSATPDFPGSYYYELMTGTFQDRGPGDARYPFVSEIVSSNPQDNIILPFIEIGNADFTTGRLIDTTPHSTDTQGVNVGLLKLNGVDYRNITTKISWIDGYSSSTTAHQMREYNIASNDFDGRPIKALVDNYNQIVMMYNDSSNNDYLTFKPFEIEGIPNTSAEWRHKLPVDVPSYGASDLIISASYATNSNWDGLVRATLFGVSATDGTLTSLLTFNIDAPNTDTTSGVQISNSSLVANNVKAIYLYLDGENYPSNYAGKFWIKGLSASIA